MSLQESDRQIEIAIVKDLNLKYLVRISLSQFEVWDLVRDSGLTDVLYESTRLDSIEWVTGFRVWKTHYLRIGLQTDPSLRYDVLRLEVQSPIILCRKEINT